jgi:hypothetical protein
LVGRCHTSSPHSQFLMIFHSVFFLLESLPPKMLSWKAIWLLRKGKAVKAPRCLENVHFACFPRVPGEFLRATRRESCPAPHNRRDSLK